MSFTYMQPHLNICTKSGMLKLIGGECYLSWRHLKQNEAENRKRRQQWRQSHVTISRAGWSWKRTTIISYTGIKKISGFLKLQVDARLQGFVTSLPLKKARSRIGVPMVCYPSPHGMCQPPIESATPSCSPWCMVMAGGSEVHWPLGPNLQFSYLSSLGIFQAKGIWSHPVWRGRIWAFVVAVEKMLSHRNQQNHAPFSKRPHSHRAESAGETLRMRDAAHNMPSSKYIMEEISIFCAATHHASCVDGGKSWQKCFFGNESFFFWNKVPGLGHPAIGSGLQYNWTNDQEPVYVAKDVWCKGNFRIFVTSFAKGQKYIYFFWFCSNCVWGRGSKWVIRILRVALYAWNFDVLKLSMHVDSGLARRKTEWNSSN